MISLFEFILLVKRSLADLLRSMMTFVDAFLVSLLRSIRIRVLLGLGLLRLYCSLRECFTFGLIAGWLMRSLGEGRTGRPRRRSLRQVWPVFRNGW